jgi:hypothetical protein
VKAALPAFEPRLGPRRRAAHFRFRRWTASGGRHLRAGSGCNSGVQPFELERGHPNDAMVVGQGSVEMTIICTHVLNRDGCGGRAWPTAYELVGLTGLLLCRPPVSLTWNPPLWCRSATVDSAAGWG